MTPPRRRRTLSLLELDPDLGRGLAGERRAAAAEQLQVELYRLPQGRWSLERSSAGTAAHVGLLLVEGIVSRDVVVADCVSTELLGPGDILRPWGMDDDEHLLRHAVRWNALTECRVAVLDRRFGARLADWPEVNSALLDRLGERARRLATTQAISQLTRVERRLVAFFWHLAERWGRLTPQGVVLPLTLSHRMLGQLVGARRPTVSTAIAALAKDERLIRRPNGTWLITGDPVGLQPGEAARVLRSRPAMTVAPSPGAEPACATPGAAALLTTNAAELRATVERLRADMGEQLGTMRGITAHTQELLDHMTELRRTAQQMRAGRAGAAAGV